MFEHLSQDRILVDFAGPEAGIAPLTWGQRSILEDMRESGNQFSMGGTYPLPEGTTVEQAATRLSGVMGRHPALRMQLRTDDAGKPYQEIASSGQVELHILTVPDDADPDEVEQYAVELTDTWPLTPFDFHRDWPLRMAVLRHCGACRHLIWGLSHLATDGGGHLLVLSDMLAAEKGEATYDPQRRHILDIAGSEQEPQTRQLSSRAMRYWESQLRDIPSQTFGEPDPQPAGEPGQRYWKARFTSAAAQLAIANIVKRTGTDTTRVTLAIVATAIARATGIHPVAIKVLMNNRFRPGLAEVIAPIAQPSAITIDVADASVDEVVARARGASLTAGMRAYYDPDELTDLAARLDAERGYPARLTCRVNDQRAMVMRDDAAANVGEATPEQLGKLLAETSLTWLGVRDNMHEQANIVLENRTDVLSVYMMWDRWSLTDEQIEALLRGIEEVAVEAAFDPAATTKVSSASPVG